MALKQKNQQDEFGGPIGLKVFAYNIVAVIPIQAIFFGVYDFYNKRELFPDHSDILITFVIAVICHLSIIALAIDAGSEFMVRSPEAIKKCKRLFLILIAYWIFVNYLPLFAHIPDEFKEDIRIRLYGGSQVILVFTAWAFYYLNKSKTVHETFGTREEPDYTPPVA